MSILKKEGKAHRRCRRRYGPDKAVEGEMSSMKRSIHIEAPVEKVFDLFKDPRNMTETLTTPFVVKDVKMTKEGVGTYYTWASKTPGLRMEGFDVYTEFVPNQRITDRSSSGVPGDWTFSFEREDSGTKLTAEVHHRSFWGMPPLRQLVEGVQSTMMARLLSAVKAKMETTTPVRAAKRAAS
ncbi:MAG: SRPBCC family protein [Betaproteobacteria bacterium]